MTYSLHTLQSSAPRPPAAPTGLARFANEMALVAGFVLIALWLIAMLSYSPQDAAWSTSGTGIAVLNRAGRLGAWIADMSYFLFGFSVWWCLAVAVRQWLASLALRLRGDGFHGDAPHGLAPWHDQAWAFWLGLSLLLYASSTLEWGRLYRFETLLPGHSGGVLGESLGPWSMRWLGFAGSGLVAIVLGLVGCALVFRFSWLQVAERLGAWAYSFMEQQRERRELAQDMEIGQQAMREREEVVFDERDEVIQHHAPPVVIVEQQVQKVAVQSTRVAKERQKPLFTEMPDSKLPQVALLDAALLRQETVSPDTLEMTSRMIEKRLKDFGVEARVVLAQPGPVITRYEIEPATGVKGAQIVGLAKDLARSLSLVSIRVVETSPGKNYMALELPNAKRQSIRLAEILGSQVYNEAKSMLTMGLGKDIIGNPVVADLAKMPHVLVAGTTGSCKSVGINAMILSLL